MYVVRQGEFVAALGEYPQEGGAMTMPRESRIDGFEQIEDPSRVLKGEGIYIEGVKPIAKPAADGNS
jgi:hypothetical protein